MRTVRESLIVMGLGVLIALFSAGMEPKAAWIGGFVFLIGLVGWHRAARRETSKPQERRPSRNP
jgi:hypothetical protein